METRAVRTVKLKIEGRVQGVGFRNWLQSVATELGTEGWVRNLDDGSVEAVVSGEFAAVAEAVERCRTGPAYARVSRLEVNDLAPERLSGFQVRHL